MSTVPGRKCIGVGPGKPRTKGGKKEKNLTVKPLRLQLEKSNTSLKETLRVGLEVSDVVPLETQVAGHGSCNDGKAGLLKHKSGFVLKPMQAPPRGAREVKFYQHLYSSVQEDDIRMRNLAPKFFGTENVKMANGEMNEFIVLENITFGMSKPCLMDIKIGRITYGPDATEAKIAKESKSYPGTKFPFGFSVMGIISHSDSGYKRLTKEFGRSLDEGSLPEILDNYLRVNSKFAKALAECFLVKLREVQSLFLSQKSYLVYGSSILFSYDYDALTSIDWKSKNSVRLNLIDFAHNFPAEDKLDENYLFGLNNLIKLFDNFLQSQ